VASPEKTVNFMLGREESRSDYHDFVCNVIKQIDLNFIDAVRSTAQLGASSLVISFTLGFLIFVATMWLISYFSGVPVKLFIRELRGKVILPILTLGAFIPLFMTGCDWTRWWVLITFDIVIVYILYTIDRREIQQVPSKKTFCVFVVVVILLAIPIGHTAHVGGPALGAAGTAAAPIGTRR
jgi:hypothetical protein